METLETPAENQSAVATTTTLEESSVPVVAGVPPPPENGVSGDSVDEKKKKMKTQVVETEISVSEIGIECFGGDAFVQVKDQGSNGVNVGDGVEGCSSVNEGGGGGGVADQVGVGQVSAVDDNNQKDDVGVVVVVKEKGLKGNVATLKLNRDDDDSGGGIRKVEVSGDCISLVVEVQGGSACMVQQEIGNEITCKERSTKDEDLEKEAEEGGEEDHNHGFSVGDLVWAKIKSHPWWPGLIYDPSDASKSAAKCRRKDRLLVAYFGDHSFAWCDPSQLKSFQENFEKMSMQSNSESFLNAIEASMDEIGRRVELEMTCACVPAENRSGQGRPLTENAGINEGIAVPEGGGGEFSVTQFEPVKFLAYLRDIAEVVSITNVLEVTLLQRRLLAFNRTRGYNQLPLYNEPRQSRAAEDSSGNGITSKSNFNEQAEELTESPPEADWLTNPEFGKTSTGNWPGISEDKLYQRKKQRTMAEIMGNDMDVEPEHCGGDATEDGTVGKQMSTPRKRKKNKDLEVGTIGDLAEEGSGSGKNDPMSKKPKKTNVSGSPSAVEEEKEVSGKNTDISGKEGSKTRERKKSKYLSYPYTSLSKETNCFLSWADPVNKIPKADRVVDVEVQLTGSPPIVKCSGETFQKKLGESPGNLSHQTPDKQKKTILKNAKVSPDEMLSEILSAALDPFYLKENNSYRSVKGFFTTFRGSLYREGFNYEIFSNYMADRCDEKKQTPDNELVPPAKDTHEIGHKTSNGESKPKRKIRKDEAMLQSPQTESEHAAGTVEPKRKRKRGKDEAKLQSPQSKSEDIAGTTESKLKKIKRKDEAMLQSPQSKSEQDEAMLQSPQSKLKHEVGTIESEPKEVMLQTPQSKLEYKAGIVEPKRKRRRKKNEAMLQSPERKLEHEAGKVESKRKRIRRKDEARLQNPQNKVEHGASTVNMKQSYNEKDNGETSGAALLLTFAAGVSLPSKDDLVTVFGKFGALNELETNVLHDSCSAQVVYVRTSDAETAFNSSGKISQFGPDMVTYRLRYLPTTSKASKHGGSTNQVLPTPSPSLVVGDQTPANQPASGTPPVSDAPPLLFIRQNLEMMTSLLERSGENLSPGTRAKLEGEIKGLLKKVATMSDSSSS